MVRRNTDRLARFERHSNDGANTFVENLHHFIQVKLAANDGPHTRLDVFAPEILLARVQVVELHVHLFERHLPSDARSIVRDEGLSGDAAHFVGQQARSHPVQPAYALDLEVEHQRRQLTIGRRLRSPLRSCAGVARVLLHLRGSLVGDLLDFLLRQVLHLGERVEREPVHARHAQAHARIAAAARADPADLTLLAIGVQNDVALGQIAELLRSSEHLTRLRRWRRSGRRGNDGQRQRLHRDGEQVAVQADSELARPAGDQGVDGVRQLVRRHRPRLVGPVEPSAGDALDRHHEPFVVRRRQDQLPVLLRDRPRGLLSA